MKPDFRTGVLSALVAMTVACGEAPKSAPPAATPAAAVATPAPVAATPAPAAQIGVPECDDFLTKYQACVESKVPEAARAQFKTGLDQWRAAWAETAKTPEGKTALVAVCKQSLDATKAYTAAYSCAW
jgi:hypothetical protein